MTLVIVVILCLIGAIALGQTRNRELNAQQKTLGGLQSLAAQKGLDWPPAELYLRAFKSEKDLEIWARNRDQAKFVLFKTYPIAAMSGRLGPKRKQGDLQVPEGAYWIQGFNPTSRFYLSMKVNYPNASDRIRADGPKPGYDIFIHGNKVSAGCLAMTDPLIAEIYTLCRAVRSPIGVSIFPFRMDGGSVKRYSAEYPQHRAFWEELEPIYSYFEKNKRRPTVKIRKDGAYSVETKS